MSLTKIKEVSPGSAADKAGLRAGETLLKVNEHPIADVLDYKYYTYDPKLTLILQKEDGGERKVKIRKEEGADLGLSFETYLMDRARSCANKCIFCFVDQLPPNLRDTLYFKDDDARLSFLMGNYVTLTNLSRREVQRIKDLHISPMNISVHATDPELRSMMLGNKNGGRGVEIIKDFASAKITMNCQIVACPGINDGQQLQKSMEDLEALYPSVNSVSIVPVGLTRWREGLYPLRPYTQEAALTLVRQVENFAAVCREKHGTSLFWCSDEFYLKAGLSIPPDEYYEEYTQMENGVGMLRLLETECRAASAGAEVPEIIPPFSIATGMAAAPFLREIIDSSAAKCHTELKYTVYPIKNIFFGETVDVAGLITGGDLIVQLKGKNLGTRLLISKTMLRHGETVFLDNVTLEEVSQQLCVPVIPVNQDGFDLFEAVFGCETPPD